MAAGPPLRKRKYHTEVVQQVEHTVSMHAHCHNIFPKLKNKSSPLLGADVLFVYEGPRETLRPVVCSEEPLGHLRKPLTGHPVRVRRHILKKNNSAGVRHDIQFAQSSASRTPPCRVQTPVTPSLLPLAHLLAPLRCHSFETATNAVRCGVSASHTRKPVCRQVGARQWEERRRYPHLVAHGGPG